MQFAKMLGAGALACVALDMLWLGVLAKGFYQRQLGHLMRPDVQWLPAALFYVIYVTALVVIVAMPAVERGSFARAVAYGAFFGLAAYSAFDLTSLALIRDFPLKAAVVDLAWGVTLSATVCAAAYWAGR